MLAALSITMQRLASPCYIRYSHSRVLSLHWHCTTVSDLCSTQESVTDLCFIFYYGAQRCEDSPWPSWSHQGPCRGRTFYRCVLPWSKVCPPSYHRTSTPAETQRNGRELCLEMNIKFRGLPWYKIMKVVGRWRKETMKEMSPRLMAKKKEAWSAVVLTGL